MSLTALPTELIEQIASYLDLPSTCSLRLTTRPLTKAISHIFSQRFFQQHTLHWTPQSLSTFLELTSQAHLSAALRHLIIDATPQHSQHLWRTRKKLSETIAITTPYGAVETASQRAALQEEYSAAQKAAEGAATFFNETRFDIKTLTRCFENLPCVAGGNHQSSSSTTHSSRLETLTFAYTGLPATHAPSAQPYCHTSQCEMSRPFISTMSALAAVPALHGLIHSITTDPQRPHGSISIGRLERLAPLLAAFDTAFESLTTLSLHLRDWRKTEEGFTLRPDTARAPFVVRFLAKARNLRCLALSAYSPFEPHVFGAMARHCRFHALERVDLSLFSIRHATDIFSFLELSFASLREIRLTHLLLCDEETQWLHVLGRLAALGIDVLPRVATLHLESLFARDGARMWIRGEQRLWFAEGEDWRAGVLEALDGIEMRASGPAWAMGAVAYPFVGLRM